jgi:hypothetical protein
VTCSSSSERETACVTIVYLVRVLVDSSPTAVVRVMLSGLVKILAHWRDPIASNRHRHFTQDEPHRLRRIQRCCWVFQIVPDILLATWRTRVASGDVLTGVPSALVKTRPVASSAASRLPSRR